MAGNDEVRNPRFPVPTLPVGALIGRVGNGVIFGIGSNTSVQLPSTGRLFLGINEGNLDDNSGAFDVTVEAELP